MMLLGNNHSCLGTAITQLKLSFPINKRMAGDAEGHI